MLLQALASASLTRGLTAEERTACDLALKAVNLRRTAVATLVEVVDALPRTVTGKVAKGRLRATLRRERLGLIE